MGKKFIDPLSDGGFKIFFGLAGKSNQFLIDFLNGLFENDPTFDRIVSVEYMNNERSPEHILEKEIKYDLHCTTSTGHRFVVEIQREVRPNFLKRTDYYVAKAVVDQCMEEKDNRRWSYMDLKPVVGVFVMETHIPGKPERPVLDYQYRDREDPGEVLDLTRKIYVQLDYFKQKEDECLNKRDQWFYILKHLENMEYMPFTQTRDAIFEKLDKYARIANLNREDRREYDRLLKFSLDYNSDMRDSREEGMEIGRAEGLAEGQREIARNMKGAGFDADTIRKMTGLSEADIAEL